MSAEEIEGIAGQVRSGIERVPAQVPPGLARSAYRRYRRHRAVARSIAAAGTAAAAAAGIATAVLLPGSAVPTMQDTGYVVNHVTQALDSMPAHTIMFNQITWTPAGTGPDSYLTDQWSNGSQTRTKVFTRAGQLLSDYGNAITGTAFKAITVNYEGKTWSRTADSDSDPAPATKPAAACISTSPKVLVFFDASQMAAALRAEVSCGELKAGGTATIHGVALIKLIGTKKHSTITYWVNPTTYLPVRATVSWGPRVPVMQDDVEWLPPTAANRAKVSLPVPPVGFAQKSG